MAKYFCGALGVLVTLFVGVGLLFVGDALGIPSYGHGGEDSSSLYALSSGVFGCVVGFWAGLSAFTRELRAGYRGEQLRGLQAWLIGSAASTVYGGVVSLAFLRFRSEAAAMVEVAIFFAGAACIAYTVYRAVYAPKRQ